MASLGRGYKLHNLDAATQKPHSATYYSKVTSKLIKDFKTGTFNAIASNSEKSKDSAGTQRILLDLLCYLVIRRRGMFSDFAYPPYIVDVLLDLVVERTEGSTLYYCLLTQ